MQGPSVRGTAGRWGRQRRSCVCSIVREIRTRSTPIPPTPSPLFSKNTPRALCFELDADAIDAIPVVPARIPWRCHRLCLPPTVRRTGKYSVTARLRAFPDVPPESPRIQRAFLAQVCVMPLLALVQRNLYTHNLPFAGERDTFHLYGPDPDFCAFQRPSNDRLHGHLSHGGHLGRRNCRARFV